MGENVSNLRLTQRTRLKREGKKDKEKGKEESFLFINFSSAAIAFLPAHEIQYHLEHFDFCN
jgi:hypothetical protein